tara:strand:- start:1109 stop:1360 length:252 start_codon:yes stop_codon:yes gene_type:complete
MMTRKPGDLPGMDPNRLSGVTAKEISMTTQTAAFAASKKSVLLPILACAVFGLAVVFVTGHVQADLLHDAAHDVRHATGFPCH